MDVIVRSVQWAGTLVELGGLIGIFRPPGRPVLLSCDAQRQSHLLGGPMFIGVTTLYLESSRTETDVYGRY